MSYLLDTHTLLWFLYDNSELSDKARDTICTENGIYVSIVSLWELAIKQSIGKLENKVSIEKIESLCYEKDMRILQIYPGELEIIKTLPPIHGDPFDRLLVAQAKKNGLTIITRDSMIGKYDCISTLW